MSAWCSRATRCFRISPSPATSHSGCRCAARRELYLRPASLFALNFVGLSTRIAGTVLAAGNGQVEVETKVGRLSAVGNFRAGSPVIVAARPEQLRIGAQGEANTAAGRVRS